MRHWIVAYMLRIHPPITHELTVLLGKMTPSSSLPALLVCERLQLPLDRMPVKPDASNQGKLASRRARVLNDRLLANGVLAWRVGSRQRGMPRCQVKLLPFCANEEE